jgi:hypothetical protein
MPKFATIIAACFFLCNIASKATTIYTWQSDGTSGNPMTLTITLVAPPPFGSPLSPAITPADVLAVHFVDPGVPVLNTDFPSSPLQAATIQMDPSGVPAWGIMRFSADADHPNSPLQIGFDSATEIGDNNNIDHGSWSVRTVSNSVPETVNPLVTCFLGLACLHLFGIACSRRSHQV